VGIVGIPLAGIRSIRNYEACEATVKLHANNADIYTVAEGDGPVNALDAAPRKALIPVYPGIEAVILDDYKVRIIGSKQGTSARGRNFCFTPSLTDA
jgi:2-isopropylmalate synthase